MRLLDKSGRRAAARKEADPTAENIDLFEGENPFADSVDEGHRIDPRAQKIFVIVIILIFVYLLGLLVPKNIFNWEFRLSYGPYSFSQFVSSLQGNFSNLVAVITGNGEGYVGFISRMIRYVVIALAGAGLALSGAVYQGAFRNALVSPSTLGVMTGGSFGVMLWVVLFAGEGTVALFLSGSDEIPVIDYLSSSYGIAAMSFAGCLFVVAIVLLVMRLAGQQRASGIMMIITGQVISGVIGVASTLVTYYYTTTDPYGEIAQLLQELQVATFYRPFTVIDIFALGIPLGLTFFVVLRLRQRMMLLAFDESEQRSMGVDSRRMQTVVVGLCTLLTAIIISFCGTVGFVGFMVPHIARRLVGPNFRYLLPASLFIGAVFVLLAYILIEVTLGTNYTTMAGMYISIAGAIVFLVTALRGKGFVYGTFK